MPNGTLYLVQLMMILTHAVNHVLQMLVYEYMPNGTLRDNLSGQNFILYSLNCTSKLFSVIISEMCISC
jgi:hypothetical protein